MQRRDLIVELDITLNGSGDYTGEWLDSSEIYTVRVVCTGSGARIEESNNQTDIIQINTVAVASEGLPYAQETIPLTARYFRVRGFGDANAALHVAVRVIA